MTNPSPKTKLLTLKVSEPFLAEVHASARAKGMSTSAYMRTLLVQALENDCTTELANAHPDGRDLGVRQVPLTRGLIALVDADDFDRVSQHKWSAMNHGSAQARIGKTRVQMHRFILGLNGDDKAAVVDHINHNRLDNRFLGYGTKVLIGEAAGQK